MSSGGECLSDLRLKVLTAEDQLIIEKKNLHMAKQKYAELREKWDEEIKRVEDIIAKLRESVKVKESRLVEVKDALQEVYSKIRELEDDIERVEKEKKRVEKENEEKKSKNVEDIRLGKELMALKQMKKDLLLSTEWVKDFQNCDAMGGEGEEGKYCVTEEFKELWNEIEKKLNIYDQTMRDLDDLSLNGQRHRLEELRVCRAKLEEAYEEVEQKNKEMEEKIKKLDEEE